MKRTEKKMSLCGTPALVVELPPLVEVSVALRVRGATGGDEPSGVVRDSMRARVSVHALPEEREGAAAEICAGVGPVAAAAVSAACCRCMASVSGDVPPACCVPWFVW